MRAITALRTDARHLPLSAAAIEEENQRLRARTQRYAGMLHRMVNEIEGLWHVSETLGRETDGAASLELVTRTVGELTQANAAAVLLAVDRDAVVASRWGALPLSVGTKESGLPGALARDFASTACEPIADAGRPIGWLWIGRAAGSGKGFGSTEVLVVRTLASMTSLAVTTLRERNRHGHLARAESPPAETRPTPGSMTPLALPRVASTHDTPTAVADRHQAQLLAGLGPVPAFSPALARLMTASDESHDDLTEVETILRLDAALAALVIRAAGSAAYVRVRPAESVREAVVVLGLRGVRRLAATQFACGLISRRGVVETLLWEQALGTAVRTHTALERLEPSAADAGYLAGLLSHVGAIALASAHPEAYARALRAAAAGDGTIAEREYAELGIDGGTVRAHYLSTWHLPAALTAVLHAPADSVQARVLDWAEHAALAANPAWNDLVNGSRHPTSATWFVARCKRAAVELGWSELHGGELEQQSRARIDTMRAALGCQ